tara:strand:+ start:401 stop:700 length:300 start_codon:yes stop_codon:yes gene_type:complete
MTAKDTRFSEGANLVRHKIGITKTTVGNTFQDNKIENLDYSKNSKIGFVPAGFEHRPDMISNLFYGTPGLWWKLMEANNIVDPFEGFNVNDRIIIPDIL